MLRLAALASLAGGCAILAPRPPPTGAVATGEPLAIVGDSRVRYRLIPTKTNPLQARPDGVRTEITSSTSVWHARQGDTWISDVDFFRIAGDEAAVAATRRMHGRALVWSFRGKLVMGGGALTAIAGFFVPHTLTRALLIGGGLFGIGGGFWIANWAYQELGPDRHAVERSVAEQSARDYNRRLGFTIGGSL